MSYVRTYTRLVFFFSHGGKDPKIGQVEGLSYTMCCNAPDQEFGLESVYCMGMVSSCMQ